MEVAELQKSRRGGVLVFMGVLALSMVVGVLAVVLIGISPLWSVGGGLVTNGGAATCVYSYIRRRRRGGGEPGREA